MMIVVTIMAVLAFAVSANLPYVTASGGLTQAGFQVQNLLNTARQNSITRNRLTAVVVLVQSPMPGVAYRTFTLLDAAQPTNPSVPPSWQQADKWEMLPNGVIIDNNANSIGNNGGNNSTFVGSGTQVANQAYPALPTLNYQGVTYQPGTGYICEIFNSGGGLTSYAPSPCVLTLTTGTYPVGSTSPSYTLIGAPQGRNSYSNYVSFFLNDETGQIKTVRP